MADPVRHESSEDETLVTDLAAGDAEALAEAYRRYGEGLFAVALRLTASRAEAEDVVQDVLVGLPERVRTFRARGSLEAWLKQVTARTALLRMRRRKERRALLERVLPGLGFLPAVGRPAPPPSLDGSRLSAALAELTDDLRVAFVLKEVEGYRHVEVADMLGISVSASKVRLHRAKKRLRELLEADK